MLHGCLKRGLRPPSSDADPLIKEAANSPSCACQSDFAEWLALLLLLPSFAPGLVLPCSAGRSPMRSNDTNGPPRTRHDHVRRRGDVAHEAVLLLLTLLLLLLAAAAAAGAADHASQRGLHEEAAGSDVTGPCHPDCTSKGNCNLEDARCECPFGYTGEFSKTF
eukprot:353182-Chlamydomonas_euryale.AAC.51